MLKATCWIHNTKNQDKYIVATISGRSQQRDCVCQQPCTHRPLIHLCDHHSSHLFASHRHQLQLSSVSGCCSEHLAQILTSYHEWPSLGSLALPRLLRHLAQDRRLFPLTTRHHRLVHPPDEAPAGLSLSSQRVRLMLITSTQGSVSRSCWVVFFFDSVCLIVTSRPP